MTDRVELPDWINALSERVIGCAIEVHRSLGPGLLESVYEVALCRELDLAGIAYQQQHAHSGEYKGISLPPQRFDLLIEDTIILELKVIESVTESHLAQLVSYIRLADKPLGLLINFHAPTLIKGTYRRINSQALAH